MAEWSIGPTWIPGAVVVTGRGGRGATEVVVWVVVGAVLCIGAVSCGVWGVEVGVRLSLNLGAYGIEILHSST